MIHSEEWRKSWAVIRTVWTNELVQKLHSFQWPPWLLFVSSSYLWSYRAISLPCESTRVGSTSISSSSLSAEDKIVERNEHLSFHTFSSMGFAKLLHIRHYWQRWTASLSTCNSGWLPLLYATQVNVPASVWERIWIRPDFEYSSMPGGRLLWMRMGSILFHGKKAWLHWAIMWEWLRRHGTRSFLWILSSSEDMMMMMTTTTMTLIIQRKGWVYVGKDEEKDWVRGWNRLELNETVDLWQACPGSDCNFYSSPSLHSTTHTRFWSGPSGVACPDRAFNGE